VIPIILATQEAEIGGSRSEVSPDKVRSCTKNTVRSYMKNKIKKPANRKQLGGVAQVVEPRKRGAMGSIPTTKNIKLKLMT
jgi:hypothetical protein